MQYLVHGTPSKRPGIDPSCTSEAETKTAIADTPECLFHHAKQLFLACALPKKEISRSPLDNVRTHGIVDRASGLLLLGDTSTEVLLAAFQAFFKLLQPLVVHSLSQELRP